jgi:lipoprotein-releasing system ATP-binding protein
MNKPELIIECNHLKKVYQEGKIATEVFNDFNLSVASGEKLALMGSSGSGKSTLLHLLGGLDTPTSGNVKIMGQDVHRMNARQQGLLRNRHLGFVYQFHHLLPEFSALENTAMPLLIGGSKIKHCKRQSQEMLKQVGLAHRTNHRLAELSGGERQRVAIARALVTRPQCLLADEPTGNIDHKTAETLYELLLELHRDHGLSLVVATHDRHLAGHMDRIIDMETAQGAQGQLELNPENNGHLIQ